MMFLKMLKISLKMKTKAKKEEPAGEKKDFLAAKKFKGSKKG